MDHTSIVSTVILSLVILVILLFGIRSMIRRATTGCCGAGENVKTIYPQDRDLSHYSYCYRLGIEGMSCQNCANRIQNAFHKQDGLYARVNRHHKEALVYAKQQQAQEVLEKIVTAAGYTVTEFALIEKGK